MKTAPRHLKECGKPRCVECRDAKTLISYHRARMRQELARKPV